MHLLGERTLGVVILVLLGMLVATKRIATGSIFDKPEGGLLVQAVNVFNLLFLLIVNPLAAILLIGRRLAALDPTRVAVDAPRALAALEIVGLVLYVAGCALMAAALRTLGRNYQLGGCAPRPGDSMVRTGPYRVIRHPMYAAALCIAGGLACLVQSGAAAGVFCVYIVLILALIPAEEEVLLNAYGDRYAAFQRQTRRLIPLVY